MITLILATDMARHAEIMDSFKEKMEDFDYSNEEHLTLVRAGALGGLARGPVLQRRPEPRPPHLVGGGRRAGLQSPSFSGKPPHPPPWGPSSWIPPLCSGLRAKVGDSSPVCRGQADTGSARLGSRGHRP